MPTLTFESFYRYMGTYDEGWETVLISDLRFIAANYMCRYLSTWLPVESLTAYSTSMAKASYSTLNI